MESIRDLKTLLVRLSPSLEPGEFVFCHVDVDLPRGVTPVATFCEDEGLSLILERSDADRAGLVYDSSFARITLRVQSSLEAVGLTAAVSEVLARRGIAANVVAAFHHDHLFVPFERADEAMAALQALQQSGETR